MGDNLQCPQFKRKDCSLRYQGIRCVEPEYSCEDLRGKFHSSICSLFDENPLKSAIYRGTELCKGAQCGRRGQ